VCTASPRSGQVRRGFRLRLGYGSAEIGTYVGDRPAGVPHRSADNFAAISRNATQALGLPFRFCVSAWTLVAPSAFSRLVRRASARTFAPCGDATFSFGDAWKPQIRLKAHDFSTSAGHLRRVDDEAVPRKWRCARLERPPPLHASRGYLHSRHAILSVHHGASTCAFIPTRWSRPSRRIVAVRLLPISDD